MVAPSDPQPTLNERFSWRGNWVFTGRYLMGHAVRWTDGNVYICAGEIFPGGPEPPNEPWSLFLETPAGTPGATGPSGPPGPQGNPGPTGEAGATGPAGGIGPAGPTGAEGPTGNTGLTGLTGATGPAGAAGPQGIPGDTGPAGIQGIPGPQGDPGVQGTPGVGIPVGGTTGKVLKKASATDHDTVWGDDLDTNTDTVEMVVTFSDPGDVAKAGTHRIYAPGGFTWDIIEVRASLSGAPTGDYIVDVNRSGTTIFTAAGDQPTIPNAGNTDLGGSLAITTIGSGQYFTADIDQINGGSDLTVQVLLRRSV